MKIDHALQPSDLADSITQLWELSAGKIRCLEQEWPTGRGAPVFTEAGKYTTRGWTQWTQGFQYGSALLQYDATGDEQFLQIGRLAAMTTMAPHVTHMGVHDHGFNNVSTYGNLWRLSREGRLPDNAAELGLYELALKCSGAVQARRWTNLGDGLGFIYSFNGPHSLFADTIRSLRSLALAHRLGHVLLDEQDSRIDLLERLIAHARTTARFAVYYGQSRDVYDLPGRVAHESIFNVNSGSYRCANSQQGYSPFTTWTRGLAWIICGYAEQLEFIATTTDDELEPLGGRASLEAMMLKAATVTADFYIEHTPTDGVPYWDTGAPGLRELGDYLNQPADPFNDWEPVDSSAAAIAAQGLLRLGHYLNEQGKVDNAHRYWQAGLTVARTILAEPYLATDTGHQGLILHSIYHRPNGWDYVPPNRRIPCGESSMWGDYHAREMALYLQRIIRNETYLTFFGR